MDELIFILIWENIYEPFDVIERGENAFQNCAYKNCLFIDDCNYFKSIMQYEAILINIANIELYSLPNNRSEKQKYISYSMEPASRHLIPPSMNGYFNLSFTYKLTSNITLPYVVVKDENDTIIGPKINMHWMKLSQMNEISDYVRSKLQNKRFAAAWISSNCERTFRMLYVTQLKRELARYGHKLHIYGRCGPLECPKGEEKDECYALIESDYYFLLAFENFHSEDYVSAKILHALEHYAVPVVLGGANYTRFVPEGIYIDGNNLLAKEMAEIMNDIIADKNKYFEFFRWHDHYSFHHTIENRYHEQVCALCAFLNNNRNQTSILGHFSDWWNDGEEYVAGANGVYWYFDGKQFTRNTSVFNMSSY